MTDFLPPDPNAEPPAWLDVPDDAYEADAPEALAGADESALDKPLAVTFFQDAFAKAKSETEISLRALVERVRDTTAPTKAGLPWLKLARFGEARTATSSLRHNANVLAITGIEADYDGEQIAVDDAVESLAMRGIAAMVYTSPRHTPDTPRWRVLCPCSRELPPDQRARLLARLNGVLGGVLSDESFTLSQSYYYGSVNRSPSHEVHLIEGQFIDLLNDLDAGAIGKPVKSTPPPNGTTSSRTQGEKISSVRLRGFIDKVLENIRNAGDGTKHHALRDNAKSLGGVQAQAGFCDGEAIDWMMQSLADGGGTVDDWNAARETADWGLEAGRKAPIDLGPDRERPEYHTDDLGPDAEPEPEQAEQPEQGKSEPNANNGWPEPFDFVTDPLITGSPTLKADHLPGIIAPFVFDTAGRMGVDPAAVALAALVSLASVFDENWKVQPKAHDYSWTEQARIWGAIVGDPSILKSPVIKATTAPIDRLDIAARKRHAAAMQKHKADLKAWKDAGSDPAQEPKMPKLDRYLVESTTIEALSEVLRDDFEAKQNAPSGKVLVRQDELTEWVGSFDRYKSGGSGGSDRGAYLRLFNGGRHSVDRVGRGSFAASSWSACIIGGIQPGPIQRIASDASDDGLLQRFCYAVPSKQGRGEDRAPDHEAIERYDALFDALAGLHPALDNLGRAQNVVLHADAHKYRLEILDLAEAVAALPDAGKRLSSALGKWPGLFARLALVFHCIEIATARMNETDAVNLNVIPAATAARVASYMRDVLLPHLLMADAVMFATVQGEHAKWIAGHILAHGLEQIAARDVTRAYGALRAPEHRATLQSVMESLETFGWLKRHVANVATPPTRWIVNPKVHALFAARASAERQARDEAKRRIAETVAQIRKGGRWGGA
ncbi:DUF3987 domain-containing protein [Acidiphilium acidophilum]|uniref:DUF3987 domain-containing protein n=1 Tax=Acidiphilium acidophilum TaxID=76588 RepID=UPI002E8E699B|nr:DUF3987 domain-containing protein [Acidiphilium acidophilum]